MALRDKPSGTIRITLSDYALEDLVWPKLRPILANFLDIKLELNSDNALRNIVEDRFDAGIRLGESVDKDMIAVRVGPDWRMLVVASPAYFERHPKPPAPQDLVQHNCINMRQSTAGGLYAWEFEKDPPFPSRQHEAEWAGPDQGCNLHQRKTGSCGGSCGPRPLGG